MLVSFCGLWVDWRCGSWAVPADEDWTSKAPVHHCKLGCCLNRQESGRDLSALNDEWLMNDACVLYVSWVSLRHLCLSWNTLTSETLDSGPNWLDETACQHTNSWLKLQFQFHAIWLQVEAISFLLPFWTTRNGLRRFCIYVRLDKLWQTLLLLISLLLLLFFILFLNDASSQELIALWHSYSHSLRVPK